MDNMMVLSRSFFLVVLLEYASAAVLHDGVDINAKIPAPIPIPGLDIENELFAINTDHVMNESGRKSFVVTQNVTVRTPFLSVQFTNSSEIPKNAHEKGSSILGHGLPLLPKASDLDEAVEHLDIPVSVAELVKLATAESPGQFREKFISSPLLESILADIEDKSKYYHEVTSLLNQPNALANQLTKKRIAKREAIFSVEQNIDGPTVMVAPQTHHMSPKKIDLAEFLNHSGYKTHDGMLGKAFSVSDKGDYTKRKAKRQAIFSLEQNIDGPTVMVAPQTHYMPPQDMDLAQLFNQSGYTIDDSILGKATSVSDKDAYAPVGRLVLPHLLRLLIHPLIHPLHHPVSASRIHVPHRPAHVARPPIIHHVVRPLLPASTLLPIVRAFANPSVIRSLLQAIPHIPPIVAPRGDQIIHPPITSYPPFEFEPYSMYDQSKPEANLYDYEDSPLDSEFVTPPKVEDRPLSPLVDRFSTLFQDFSLTR